MARIVAAMYEDKAHAQAARDDLQKQGGPDRKVHLLDHSDPGDVAITQIPAGARAAYERGLREGAVLVTVRAEDDQVDDTEAIMNRHNPIDINERFARTETGRASRTAARGRREDVAEDEETIPVVEEELQVGKREVAGGGVRVRSHVIETPVEEDVTLREEHVDVERRKVDRPVTDADRAFKDRTIEAHESREEAVVNKRARVVEEIVLHKHTDTHTEHVSDTVKKTDVDIDQLEPDFRKDAQTRFGGEYDYDQVSPAYRYGAELGRTENRDWKHVEADARTRFEQRNPGKWDQFGGAVQHGYNRARTGR